MGISKATKPQIKKAKKRMAMREDMQKRRLMAASPGKAPKVPKSTSLMKKTGYGNKRKSVANMRKK